jgi:hypothetical protein
MDTSKTNLKKKLKLKFEIRYPKEENQWTILLKRQEEYYQTKLNGLHSVLISTHDALKNVCSN